MSSDDVVHRIGVLESRVDRVCKFLSGMYWSSYLEEFKSLEQKVMGLDKSLYERINEVNDKKVDREDVSVIVEGFKEKERKKKLAKEVFSDVTKNNMAQIKVEYNNIKEVDDERLKGLSLIMKDYGNVSLYECFKDCKNITILNFPSTFNTINVTDMSWMFDGCSSLSSLDLSTFNTSSVTSMSCMFSGCSRLSSVDLSTFNTSSVTDMRYMFEGCKSLTSLDLSTFNTSNVKNMCHMFSGCSSLSSLNLAQFKIPLTSGTTLDISTFDTSSVIFMNDMFYGCSNLTSLDLSRFNTSNARNVDDMFSGCSRLKEVYVKDGGIISILPDGVNVKIKKTYNTTCIDSLTL